MKTEITQNIVRTLQGRKDQLRAMAFFEKKRTEFSFFVFILKWIFPMYFSNHTLDIDQEQVGDIIYFLLLAYNR
jgi:hypothetical protein